MMRYGCYNQAHCHGATTAVGVASLDQNGAGAMHMADVLLLLHLLLPSRCLSLPKGSILETPPLAPARAATPATGFAVRFVRGAAAGGIAIPPPLHPPVAAAEFHRRAATASPSATNMAPVAATATADNHHRPLRLPGRLPQLAASNTGAPRRIRHHRRRSSAPSFACYRRCRRLTDGSYHPTAHNIREPPTAAAQDPRTGPSSPSLTAPTQSDVVATDPRPLVSVVATSHDPGQRALQLWSQSLG